VSTRALIGVLLAGTAGVVIFFYVQFSSDPNKPISVGSRTASACSQAEGDCLPDLGYITSDGQAYTAKTLKGKVVVVNFWATWCPPCKKEIPDLSRVYDRYKSQGVVMLGVMTDSPTEPVLAAFRAQYNMTYPVVRATLDIVDAFHEPDRLPTTFIYNKKGKQVYSHIGPLDDSELAQMVERFLAEKD
jgi:cytochrome c biogenesis protein CcmG/thiol:disulfide interchange protein DsbE